jgi:hypothetical protein
MTASVPFDSLYVEGAPEECWLWEGTVDPSNGYGRYGKRRAHVVACEAAHGPKPGKGGVRHSCDVKLCVNPRHLQWGTQSQNCRDIAVRGLRKGERAPVVKLDDDKVREIRSSTETTKALAEKFGVHYVTIHDVRKGRTWTHVGH